MPFPFIGALAAAAPVLGAGIASAGQAAANRQNLQIAREQMQFQERMSSSSYQRAVEDMRRAGLNPALAYQQGGASSPVGSSATMENPLEPVGRGVTGAGSAVLEYQSRRAAIAQQRAQADLTRAQTNQLELESALRAASLEARIRSLNAGAQLSGASAARTKLDADFMSRSMENRLRQVALNLAATGARTARDAAGTVESGARRGLLEQQLKFLTDSHEGRLAAIALMNRLTGSRADVEDARASHEPVREEYTRELINLLRRPRSRIMRGGFVNSAKKLAELLAEFSESPLYPQPGRDEP